MCIRDRNITLKIKLHLKIILGFLVGFISAPMGIGGAVMNVPILKFFGISIVPPSMFNCFRINLNKVHQEKSAIEI